MTTLHMEVETARSTQSTMVNTHQQLNGMLQSMTSSVNGLQSAWMGNSASEFFNLYDEWRSQMSQLLDRLNQMNQSLATEINQWEQVASKLA